MVKFISLTLAVVLGSYAFGQPARSGQGQSEPIQLGDATPVDVHVLDVSWHENGKAFIYGRQEENGKGIGVYALGKHEGKTLIHLAKGETYYPYWLGVSNSALIVIRGTAPEDPKSNQIRMFVLDADTQVAKQVFQEVYDPKVFPQVTVDPSPILKHAIITLRSSEGARHMIICNGNGELIKAPDLDRAEKEGMTGPSWSLDGTGIYANIPYKSFVSTNEVPIAISGVSGATARLSSDVSFEIVTSNVKIVEGQPINTKLSLSFRAVPPTPPTGSQVLELMPSNAVLRPVRFRGPFVPVYAGGIPLVPRSQSIVLQYEKSSAQDNSVWIKRGTQKGTPATLLAVHASQTWLSPKQSAVAYVIDGALFVRTIK